MIARALVIWLVLMVTAMVNGATRELFLAPYLSRAVAHLISTAVLCGLILLIAWWTITWIRPPSLRAAVGVGLLWLALTVTFEFIAGHYLFGQTWERLLEDYNLALGRVWALVLITCSIAPPWMARARGLFRQPALEEE